MHARSVIEKNKHNYETLLSTFLVNFAMYLFFYFFKIFFSLRSCTPGNFFVLNNQKSPPLEKKI